MSQCQCPNVFLEAHQCLTRACWLESRLGRRATAANANSKNPSLLNRLEAPGIQAPLPMFARAILVLKFVVTQEAPACWPRVGASASQVFGFPPGFCRSKAGDAIKGVEVEAFCLATYQDPLRYILTDFEVCVCACLPVKSGVSSQLLSDRSLGCVRRGAAPRRQGPYLFASSNQGWR